MSKTALLLIDIQNDYFEGGKWTLNNTDKAAANAAQLLALFREHCLPVIHIRHEFASDDAPFFAPGSEGAQIHSSVTPLENETVIVKQQINSFRDTELKQVLEELGIEKLIVAGAMSHICIDAAVRAAADMGYSVAVAEDACTTLDIEFNGMAVAAEQVHACYMAALEFGYAEVTQTRNLLASLS